MADFGLDPSIYSGLTQDGRDLMTRLGPDKYYWVRLGFTAPARLSALIFGQVGGFFVLRYILALVAILPVYLLLRQLKGRAAGALGVVLLLGSPVTWTTWGSDYPDSAAFSYLAAGAALLVLPARRLRRHLAVACSGVLLTLAVHCQFVAVVLVLPILLGYLLVYGRADRLRVLLAELAELTVAAALVTAALVAVAWAWLGQADIFAPTLRVYRILQQPSQQAMWHSANWHWTLTVPYVAVPFAAVLGWLVTAALDRGRVGRPEMALGLGACLEVAVAGALQFAGTTAMLEYHLYSSMLWPGVLLLTALAASHLGRVVPGTSKHAWRAAAPTSLALLIALLSSSVMPALGPRPFHDVVAIAGLVVLAAVGVAAQRVGPRLLALTIVLVGLTTLTTAVTQQPSLAHTVNVSHGQYGVAFGNHNWSRVQAYELASRAQALIPKAKGPGQRVVTWWADGAPGVVLEVAGRFQFFHLAQGLPSLESIRQTSHVLADLAPDPLVMMGADEAQFQPFLASLPPGTMTTVLRRADLHEGDLHLLVWVVQLDRLVDPCPGETICPGVDPGASPGTTH